MKAECAIMQESRELSLQEQRTLEACEADIAKGVKLQAEALQTIRDKRLYRREFSTFDEYLADRIGKSRAWADRQINYIEVCANIAQITPIGVKVKEAATREISDLEPEKQVEVVQQVVKSGDKPTAKNIKAAREQVAPKQQLNEFFEGKSEPEPAATKPVDEVKIQRQKTVKTIEALIRSFDDLQQLQPRNSLHGTAINGCKGLLTVAREWK